MAKKHRPAAFPPPLFPLHTLADDATLRHISRADYGMDAEQHFTALKQVLDNQNGYLADGQHWHPAEVFELTSYSAEHPAVFTLCHLIILQNLIHGSGCFFDVYGQVEYAGRCATLPLGLQKLLDNACQTAREHGAIDG
ncbi:hypothetical protein ACG2K1_07665 [Neisseria sp. 23W00296]|uniref:hypothetical protein n=1 Tax=unclassified Neisseria TaxID=2623750 RepID=UPI0037584E0F